MAILLVTIGGAMLSTAPPCSAQQSGDTYRIESSGLTLGGGDRSTLTYRIDDSIGNSNGFLGAIVLGPGIGAGVWVDTDGDGLDNPNDPDDDNDGILDSSDSCPCDANNDLDADGICANDFACQLESDNCPDVPNPDQADGDGDGRGDVCDEAGCFVRVAATATGVGTVDCTRIQDCIDRVTDGCLIEVAPGVYRENVVVDRAVVIYGESGPIAPLVRGQDGDVVTVDSSGGAVGLINLRIGDGEVGLRLLTDTAVRGVSIDDIDDGIVIGDNLSAAPLVSLFDITVLNADQTGLQIESGDVLINRGWIRQGGGDGIVIESGTLFATSFGITQNEGAAVDVLGDSVFSMSFGTISGNDSGIVANLGPSGSVDVVQSIVYGNGPSSGIVCGDVNYSMLDTVPGTCCLLNPTNLCDNPDFISAAGSDYRLSAGSPAIDAGVELSAYAGYPCRDRLGDYRVMDGDADGVVLPDLGAYEMRPAAANRPQEVTNLTIGAAEELLWSAKPVPSYRVYRVAIEDLGYDMQFSLLAEPSSPGYFLIDGDPLPGSGFLYLVSAVGLDLEGPLGFGTCAERDRSSLP